MRVGLRALGKQRVWAALAVLLGMSCALFWYAGNTQVQAAAPSAEPLRSYADKMHFWFGTALQGLFWGNAKYTQIVSTQFNSGVSMTLMGQTQPQPGKYDFHIIDNQSEFARKHDMKLFGVALLYRPGAAGPAWFAESCRTMSKEKMDTLLKEHIHAVVTRGGDAYYGWEVVNEHLVPGHNGCWSKVLGDPDYIAKAFRYAREANPKAQLMLNDGFGHDGIDKERAKEFFELIRKLKADNVPIDVAGTQMHLRPENLRPTYVEEFKSFIEEARKVGVQVQVTEMDVMLPPNGGPEMLQKQKEIFYNILHTCLKDSNCTGFTLWGTGDHLRNARGGNDPAGDDFWKQRPNIYDDNLEPKPAYEGILQALKEGR